MQTYNYNAGSVPVLMSIPHLSKAIPEQIASQMTDAGRQAVDTDWDLDRLYDFAAELGLHAITPMFSRNVIDLNRAPDGVSLYAGVSNTELVPTSTFHDQDIYLNGRAPGDSEIEQRKKLYWEPYHACIRQTLDDIKEQFGQALLFDCHSIRSEVPRFFQGKLPEFNLGTADGKSCSIGLRSVLAATLENHNEYTLAVDGRFKGGYITRQYGDPDNGIHTFQMELSQATYADPESPYKYSESLAERVRPALREMLEAARHWISHIAE